MKFVVFTYEFIMAMDETLAFLYEHFHSCNDLIFLRCPRVVVHPVKPATPTPSHGFYGETYAYLCLDVYSVTDGRMCNTVLRHSVPVSC